MEGMAVAWGQCAAVHWQVCRGSVCACKHALCIPDAPCCHAGHRILFRFIGMVPLTWWGCLGLECWTLTRSTRLVDLRFMGVMVRRRNGRSNPHRPGSGPGLGYSPCDPVPLSHLGLTSTHLYPDEGSVGSLSSIDVEHVLPFYSVARLALEVCASQLSSAGRIFGSSTGPRAHSTSSTLDRLA